MGHEVARGYRPTAISKQRARKSAKDVVARNVAIRRHLVGSERSALSRTSHGAYASPPAVGCSCFDGMLDLFPVNSLPALEKIFVDFRNCGCLQQVHLLRSAVFIYLRTNAETAAGLRMCNP